MLVNPTGLIMILDLVPSIAEALEGEDEFVGKLIRIDRAAKAE